MVYVNEFVTAIKRTQKLKLELETPFIDSSGRYIKPETYKEVKKIILESFPEFSSGKYAKQCMDISLKAKVILEDYFNADIFFTIGDISVEGKKQFNFDEKYIKKLLASKQFNANLKLHAWLTLPSLEIIDLSLAQSVLLMSGDPISSDYILSSPDKLKDGLEYHPMIIGENFLHKTGNLVYL